ncbi:MAG: glycoside hydrolase family 140 protein [Deltaproteobacteria bacterium]|nr:glycoside hydrolase family 140 protein [Deltaproteobacteria bacterium]
MYTEKALPGPAWNLNQGALRVHENRRQLVHTNGQPFFWLADTAWELFHRTTREEAALYLDKRRGQGFTVVQAVALAELDGLRAPNSYGHTPLLDMDPARPDISGDRNYWTHVDDVFDIAEAHGITIAFLPTWGDKVGPKEWGIGPEVFTCENAFAYGRFLGARYGRRKNLVWVIGGDRFLVYQGRDHRPVWRALVAGIKEGEGDAHNLMTFHPVGGQSSSLWLHDEPWLDFNMMQSGHAKRGDSNHDMIRADLARPPYKPVVDGEPRYEDHPVDFKDDNGWFTDADVRQAAYSALFAGACGHTYGCHPVWQMLDGDRTPITRARRSWKEAIDLPGAWDMQHVRTLVLSRPVLGRMADPSLVADGQGEGIDRVEACRDSEGKYALIYVPTGRPVTVNLARLRVSEQADGVQAHWFDPRTGQWLAGPKRSATRLTVKQTFFPPAVAAGPGNDFVLVLDRLDETPKGNL